MAPALAAVTVGGWFAYSALTGKSLGGVFTGAGKQDPSGTLDPAKALQAAGIDTSQPLSVGGIPLSTGGDNLSSMTAEMNRMIGLRQPYKWGGGHAAFDPDGPWDCSGAVSWIAHYNGMLNGSPMTSTGFMRWGVRGSVLGDDDTYPIPGRVACMARSHNRRVRRPSRGRVVTG
jgi:cell wall-associated NlpC family hydrolase